MNDITLVAINAKYTHTSLAVRYLKNAVVNFKAEIVEASINDSFHGLMDRLLQSDSRVYGFSCYIWNIEIILKLAETLKKAKPEAIILFGGPEVSFDARQILKSYWYVDLIISGPAEKALKQLLTALNSGTNLGAENIFIAEKENLNNLRKAADDTPKLRYSQNEIVFAYSLEELKTLKNRIIYYETMRGCPYNCSYCLSSVDKKMQIRKLEEIIPEIDLFFAADVKQVKLVDRTFNCQPQRAMAIFEYIINKANKSEDQTYPNFHFEMTGDQISADMINLLKKAPLGLIQFEIGVQSTCPQTLKAIGRPIKFLEISRNVKALLLPGNIHIHLDLIAGLPYEDFGRFGQSFNDVFSLRPDMLQLGFLKGLKGTRIRSEVKIHGYQFSDFSPYEIVKNDYISATELYILRNMESLLDRYYNSGNFKTTLKLILFDKKIWRPFDFFLKLTSWWKEKGYFEIGVSKENLYRLLYEFLKSQNVLAEKLLENALVFDFIFNNQQKLPDFLPVLQMEKQKTFEFIMDENNQHYFKEFKDLPAKKIFNRVKIIEFDTIFCNYFFNDALHMDAFDDSKGQILFTQQTVHYLK